MPNTLEANRGERRFFAGMEVLLIEGAGRDMVDELIPSLELEIWWGTVSGSSSEKKLVPSPPAEGE